MTVRFLDLSGPTETVRARVLRRWDSILDNTAFVLGAQGREFEERFAEFLDVGYCSAVNSGTDALHLALEALGTKQGDIVVAPANTFIATCSPVFHLQAELRLVNPTSDHTICPDEVEALAKKLSSEGKRIHAVMAVHLYGQPANVARLAQLASEHGFSLIEDCAQAHAATVGTTRVGGFGAVSCFSFYPGKNMGAFGDGGAVVTNDATLRDRIELLRNQGSVKKYQHDILGHCSRMDELQAAVLNEKLDHIEQWTQKRQAVASRYQRALGESVTVSAPVVVEGTKSAYHLYVVRVKDGRRSALQEHLSGQGVQTLIHYPVPIHKHQAFRGRLGPQGDLRFSEQLAEEILSLPIYPELGESSIDLVAAGINSFAR